MSFDLALRPVHALSVMPPGTRVSGTQEASPAGRLRLREVMQVQQALHNAHLPAPTDHLALIGEVIGRRPGSLTEIRAYELRPLIRYLTALSAQHRN